MPSPRDEGQTDHREVIPREREDEIEGDAKKSRRTFSILASLILVLQKNLFNHFFYILMDVSKMVKYVFVT